MSNLLKEKIEEVLKKVIDPGTGEDVINMGLIKDLEVFDGGKVSLRFRPSLPICPLAFKIAFDIKNAIKDMEGISEIDLEVIDYVRAEELNKMLKERKENGQDTLETGRQISHSLD